MKTLKMSNRNSLKYILYIILFLSYIVSGCQGDNEVTEYYKSGEIKTKYQKINGYIDGIFYEYFKDGKVKKKIHYSEGVKDGEYKSFYPNGQIKILTEYENGLQNGVFKSYTEKGVLSKTGYFIRGQQSGQAKLYYKDGKLKSITDFKDNVPHGSFQQFHPSGKIQMEAFYEKDTVIYYTEYSKDGEILDYHGYIDISSNSDTLYSDQWNEVQLRLFGIKKDTVFANIAISNEGYFRGFEPVKLIKGITNYSFKPINTGSLTLHINLYVNGDTLINKKNFIIERDLQ